MFIMKNEGGDMPDGKNEGGDMPDGRNKPEDDNKSA